jgi:hypothetical protein
MISEAQRDRQRALARPLETYLRRRRASQVLWGLGAVATFMGVYLWISPFRAPALSTQPGSPAPLADTAHQKAAVQDVDAELSRLAAGLAIAGAASLLAGYLIRPRAHP